MPAVWSLMIQVLLAHGRHYKYWEIVGGHAYIHMSHRQKMSKAIVYPWCKNMRYCFFGGGPIVLFKSSLNNTKTQQICFSSRFPKSVSSKISKISCSLLFARIGHFFSRCLSGILEKNANGINWVYPSSGVPFSTKVIAWLLLGLLFFGMPWWSRKPYQ